MYEALFCMETISQMCLGTVLNAGIFATLWSIRRRQDQAAASAARRSAAPVLAQASSSTYDAEDSASGAGGAIRLSA